MTEYLEKSAVIKAIHDEIYDGGKWNGGWYEHSEEQAEKNFTKRINAITPEKVIDISVIEKIHDAIDNAEPDIYIENPLFNGFGLTKEHVHEIIDKAVKEIKHECSACKHSDELDGEHCYECVKGLANNFAEVTKNGN